MKKSELQAAAAWDAREWLFVLALIFAVLLVYQPAWNAGFVWDDDMYLARNPCIVGPYGLKEIWATRAADICPLTITTFWVEHALWGLKPAPYHFVTILLHGAAAVVLWRVLQKLKIPGAWLGAALWAVHPVQVESVAWIAETKNTESGLFFLLAILFFLRSLDARAGDGRTGLGWNYPSTMVFAALAMASKSSTVVLPVILGLCAWWVEGRWNARTLVRVVPLLFFSIVVSAVSIWTQKLQLETAPDPQWVRTWPERVAAAGDAVWFYLGKLVFPNPLITIYPRWKIDANQWGSYLPSLAVVLVLLLCWFKRDSWARPWFFAFGYFVVALIPVLGLFDNSIFRLSLVFDHFQYLASMGPLALAGAGVFRLVEFVAQGKQRLQAGLGAGLVLLLGILSWDRARVYQGEQTLWADTVEQNGESWLARTNLGLALAQKGEGDQAIKQWQKAIEINPNYADAYYSLGVALAHRGETDAAIEQYRKAILINPGYANAHYNLGNAFFQKRQLDEAIDQYREAVKVDTDFVEAHYNLGNALAQKGRLDDAITELKIVLQIKPAFGKAQNNLGNAYLQQGQVDTAIMVFEVAVQLNPDDINAKNNLTKARAIKGQK